MRKFLSFCVFALFATASFSQYSIKMERMEADGQIYYQGELPLKSYVDDAEDGFLPALNTAYVVDLKNLTTNTQMGKLQVNIVDRAESNGWWTEVNPTYKVLGEDITPSDAITQEAKIFVMNLGDEPEAGKYTLIFHAWGVYENVDEVTLTIEDLSMATLVDMYLEETSLELSTGETSDVKSLVRYSLFEETETDKYPLFSSSNPKVVEIDENGVITAVAPGTATITITTLGKLLTAIDEYEAGALLTRENELQVTVSLKPNVVFAWNSYGTDVEGVGEEGVSDYWQYSNTEKIPDALDAFESGLASTWTASEGDSFTIHIKGVSKVTGTLDLVLVDQRQEVNNWGEMSDFERSIAITEGEEFDITKTMEIKYFQNAQGVSYAMPDFIMEFSPSNGSEYGKDNTVDFSLTTFDVSYTPAVEIATPIVENTEYKYCKNAEAVALEVTATENGVLVWYDSNYNVLESAPTPSTENVGTQVFYVSQIIDEVESAKKAINVTINDLPSVYISGNTSVKAEESFTLTAVAYSSFGIDSYSWTIGDEASEETSENVTTSLSSSTKVAVTVTDNESCSSTAEQYVTVFSAEPPVAVFAEDEYTVEVGETITITPSYTAVDDFSNLSFLLKEYNGCVQFETKIDGTCAVSGLAEGSDSLILNLTYSNGVDTYKLNDTCKIIVVPSQKVPQPKVNKTEYVYCQYDEPEAFAIDVTEGTTLQWYDKTNGEYVRLYNDPVVSTDYAYNAVYAVSQVRDGLESAKVEISIVVNARPALEVTYPKIAYVDSNIEIQAQSSVASSYVWSNGYEETTPTTESAISVSFSHAGTHNFTVIASANGCDAKKEISLITKVLPSISFEKESYSVFTGETISVAPLFDNMIAGDDAQWTVADETIASVENQENGTIKAEGIGSTVVTYSTTYTDPDTKYTKKYSASYTLQVTEFVESIVCENVSVEMFTGERFFVDAVVHSLEGKKDYHLETSSQDSLKIDIVDKMITAVEAGEVVVNVISDNNASIRTALNITIKPFISAKEISLPKQVTILVGADTTLVASVIPANASYAEVSFLEKDDDIVTVTADGKIVGKTVGTSIVSASTKEGLQAQTMVYVTSSDEEIVKIRLNNGDEAMYLKVGESKTVSCQVSPTTIKANDLVWASGNPEIATVSPSGIVTAVKEGELFLHISYKTSINETIKVFVTKSNAPTISFIPTVAMQQQGASATIDLSSYVTDDVTEFNELQLSALDNENIDVTIQEGIAKLTLKNATFVGNTSVTISATDEENLTTSRSIDVQVAMKANEAPVVAIDTIVVPFGKYTQIVIADMVKDDYTASADLDFDFEEGENLIVKKIKNTSLRITALEDDWSGTDYLTVTFTDAENLVTEKQIVVIVQEAENQAPVIAEIPQQNEIGTELFSNIDLSQYVSDDYTSPSNIVWSATTSENVSVKFSGCYAEIADLNEYWRGAEVITFTAMDQGGLTSSIDVTFYRMTETTETEQEFGWYGKPTVKIITSRYYGNPGDEFTLIGTFYGSECSGEWIIDGVELSDPYALIQTLKFPETGFYDVTFKVMYGEGEITEVGENLVVYGIEQRNAGICIGSNTTLTATDGVDSYVWSTNETSQSIEIAPETTQTYVLTMHKGLTTMTDSVTVRVSVPVSLREDSVMCAGTKYELVAQGEYESYSWNTGETTQSIVIPAAVANYTVTTQDDLGCESSATFKVTAVNDLPAINLGDDKTVCDKVITTLDAGAGFVYAWDITKYDGSKVNSAEQSISLDSSAYVTIKIVDNNQCENFDTITVTYTYPYPEEIGIITYSESSKNLIVAWERTIDVNTVSYQVERKINDTQWEKVGDAVPFTDFGIVVDEATNFEGRAYNYRLLTTDGCNNTATSGVYRSSFIQSVKTQDGNYGVNWWTYKSPRQGNVVGSYLLRKTDPSLHADGLIEGYEVIDNFSSEDDFIGWTDTEGSLKPGDMVRVAFALDETVYENAVKDTDGNVVELQTKAESGPFSIAISNIAEVENTDAIESLFPADVAVYPTIVKDVINIALVAYEYNNFTIEVLDANGKVVAKTQTGDVVKAVVQIPASELSQGIYTVKLSADDAVKTVKVVK
ncbi:MAG: Ig-like domain-containing protein [Bacteroidales bacterium]|nr:Ig-like domain-containing protein [Bacteroidales bacterium]